MRKIELYRRGFDAPRLCIALAILLLWLGLIACFVLLNSRFAVADVCDRTGQCHPEMLAIDRPVLIRLVENPAAIDPFKRQLVAFSMTELGPVCQVFIRRDERDLRILLHELRHCIEGNFHGK